MPYNQRRPRKLIYDVTLGEPPTEEQIEKMKRQSKNVVEYWLSQADKTRKELKDKLLKKGIIDEIIEETLDSYAAGGYIDDERYAENFVYSKTKYDRLGKRAVAFKLREKGIDADTIQRVTEEIDEELEEENAKEIALKKARQNQRFDDQKRIQQIAGMLARKGYSGGLIFKLAKEAIEEVRAENEED